MLLHTASLHPDAVKQLYGQLFAKPNTAETFKNKATSPAHGTFHHGSCPEKIMVRVDQDESYDIGAFVIKNLALIAVDVDAPTSSVRRMERVVIQNRIERIQEKNVSTLLESLLQLFRQLHVCFVERAIGIRNHFLRPSRYLSISPAV
jgi:hypothetical protein